MVECGLVESIAVDVESRVILVNVEEGIVEDAESPKDNELLSSTVVLTVKCSKSEDQAGFLSSENGIVL